MTNKELIEAFKESTKRMQEEAADQYAELSLMSGEDPDPDLWTAYCRLSKELSDWYMFLEKKQEDCL